MRTQHYNTEKSLNRHKETLQEAKGKHNINKITIKSHLGSYYSSVNYA